VNFQLDNDKVNIRNKIIMIVVFSFFFNLLWEVLHSLLYDWNKEPLINDIYVYIPRIVFYATLFDAIWISTFIMWNSVFQRSLKWLKNPSRNDYLAFLILGIIYAILIEWSSIVFNLWEYHPYMPLIFGIGFIFFIGWSIWQMIK
jgi:uncharacterized membrane protein